MKKESNIIYVRKPKKKKSYSRRTRKRRISVIIEENRIDDMDHTVIDKNIWTDDLCGGTSRCLNKGSGRVGDKRQRLASCGSDVRQQVGHHRTLT